MLSLVGVRMPGIPFQIPEYKFIGIISTILSGVPLLLVKSGSVPGPEAFGFSKEYPIYSTVKSLQGIAERQKLFLVLSKPPSK